MKNSEKISPFLSTLSSAITYFASNPQKVKQKKASRAGEYLAKIISPNEKRRTAASKAFKENKGDGAVSSIELRSPNRMLKTGFGKFVGDKVLRTENDVHGEDLFIGKFFQTKVQNLFKNSIKSSYKSYNF